MPEISDERDISALRRYLQVGVSDTRSRGREDIDSTAEAFGLAADDIRSFRDGNDGALAKPVVKMFMTILGRGDPLPGVDMDDSLGFADPSTGGWYGAMLAEETIRQARLRQYQLIVRTRPESDSAVDAWADLGVTGTIGETSRFAGGFEPTVKGTQASTKLMNEISAHVNTWLLPEDDKIKAFRGMVTFGDQFGCLGLGQSWDNKNCISKLEPRHARTMYVVRGDKGEIDPNKYWKQVLPGRHEPIAYFPEWQVAHFSNQKGWGDIYGASIFESSLRSYIQVEAMEAAMIIRRLERASQRYKWKVDVGAVSGGDDEVLNFLRKFRGMTKKQRTVDNSGNFRVQKISAPPEEDLYVPVRDKSSPADVEVLTGDANLGEIADFQHFFAKFLAGMGPPKAHLGYEADTMRSVITDLHIVFARKVRRMQLKFIRGLNHLYWVSLMVRGIDPRSINYAIFPPSLGTRDELVRAQVQQTNATTAFYLARAIGMTGKTPSARWMLKYVMHMDDEAIDDGELDLQAVVQQQGAGIMKNDPAKGSGEARAILDAVEKSPEIQTSRDSLAFLMEERAYSKGESAAVDKMFRICSPIRPSMSERMGEACRAMRVGELRSA